jgi:hypothetical protein
MVTQKLGQNTIGAMDELDLNSFSIKPDALVFYTMVQIVGVLAKNIEQGKPLIEGLMIKCMMVDDLEDLCEAQNYINPDAKNPVTHESIQDPYYEMVKQKTLELKLAEIDADTEALKYWQQNAMLARHKMKFLEKRVFSSNSKFKELLF